MKASGQYAKIDITVDGTPVQVVELREWNISASTNKIDSTVAGKDWTEHEVGHGSWEGDATILDIDTYWVDHLFAKVNVKFYFNENDAAPAYEGSTSIDFETGTPYDDMIETSLTFTGDGPLTKGTELAG
ncbi:hypothetical protein [Rossellomorea marisflavi]|uniref:hypothetical protein n=1 Tax=Rossellomorea marisflavi TaxID=189381 RepID=UPI0009A712F8|nr:hypothetical protein [Rossellomorea marisflavi]